MIYEYFRATGAYEAVPGLAELVSMRFRREMGSCTIVSEWNAFKRDPGRIVQVKISEFRSTSDCDGIVWSRCCSKQWDTQLSTIENSSETSYWSNDEKSQLQSPERCCGTGISYQESKGNKACVKKKVGDCFQWNAQGQCSKGDSCSFSHDPLASGNKGSAQRRKGRSSSPASHSKAKRTDGEEQKSPQGSGNKQENSTDKWNSITVRTM